MESNNPNANKVLHRLHRVAANAAFLNDFLRQEGGDFVTDLDLSVATKVDELLSKWREAATTNADLLGQVQ